MTDHFDSEAVFGPAGAPAPVACTSGDLIKARQSVIDLVDLPLDDKGERFLEVLARYEAVAVANGAAREREGHGR